MKNRIKLRDSVVRVKDTSCKATCKIKDLKLLNIFFQEIAYKHIKWKHIV